MSNRSLYNAQHRRDRQRWGQLVGTGGVACWRCGGIIGASEGWDLGHRDGMPSHPEHTGCNRAAGATAGNMKREPRSEAW
jgi:hypothetical protein